MKDVKLQKMIFNNYERCVSMLDMFDNAQINAIYKFIDIINCASNIYYIDEDANRTSILNYLIKLKDNKNDIVETTIYNRIFQIHTAMAAMSMLKLEYGI